MERRLETATEAESLDYKLYLGRLYLDRLHTPDRSLPVLEDVLRLRESDADARQLVERLLEVGSLRLRAARVLEAVYEARDEMRNLVRVLDIRREGTTDTTEKKDLLRRVSELRDERLRDDAGAFAALAELVPLEPEDATVRERLVEIGRRLGEHEKVATVLTSAADACSIPATRGEILMEVARIGEERLNDVDRAERVYRRVTEIDASDPALVIPAARALARLYAAAGKSEELAQVLGIEVRLEDDTADAPRPLRAHGHAVRDGARRSRQGDRHVARAAQRRLRRRRGAQGPRAALRTHQPMARARQRAPGARAIDHRRPRAPPHDDEGGGDAGRASSTISARPSPVGAACSTSSGRRGSTLAALASLYERAERWPDLADTLEVDLSLAEETADRLALLARLGDVRRLHQDDLPGALDAYRQALTLDPANGASRKALEAMLDLPDARRDAAETLHPLYEADGDAERLLKVLEIEVETTDSASDRLETLQKALRTAEGRSPIRRAPSATPCAACARRSARA